jgi:hypothetical protein
MLASAGRTHDLVDGAPDATPAVFTPTINAAEVFADATRNIDRIRNEMTSEFLNDLRNLYKTPVGGPIFTPPSITRLGDDMMTESDALFAEI